MNQVRNYRAIVKCNLKNIAILYGVLILFAYINITYKREINKKVILNKTEFIIERPICCDCNNGLCLAIVVHSALEHFKNRAIIRKTWGKAQKCLQTTFIFGLTSNKSLSQKIIEESQTFGDIVQGNFIDSYQNMTYKHMTTLKWAIQHCTASKYILKTDDDIMVNTPLVYRFLNRDFWGDKNLIACSVMKNSEPYRYDHRYAVPYDQFNGFLYPNYCLGPFIIYSRDVAPLLLRESLKAPFLWLDDVLMTGIIAKRLLIEHMNLTDPWYLSKETMYAILHDDSNPKGIFLYGPFDLTFWEMKKFWKEFYETTITRR